MEELVKKIQQLNDLLKAVKAFKQPVVAKHPELPKIPAIKPIPTPSIKTKAPMAPKIPGANPGSKKDPGKVAEQLQSGKVKKTMMPMLKFDKNGQWHLSKEEPNASCEVSEPNQAE